MTDNIETYTFANGLKLRREFMLDIQVERYQTAGNPNLHEPEEEHWFNHILSQASPHGMFLDVGAALGYYSALVRSKRPGWIIRAMEPLPRMRMTIAETFELNGLSQENLTLDPRAVSLSDGKKALRDHKFGSHIVDQENLEQEDVLQIESCTLEQLIADISAPVSLMKMDIQGHEQQVLENSASVLAQRQIEWMIIGTHGGAIHKRVVEILSENYQIVHQDSRPPFQPDGLIVARALQS